MLHLLLNSSRHGARHGHVCHGHPRGGLRADFWLNTEYDDVDGWLKAAMTPLQMDKSDA
jgi:hypothetical protein